MGRGVGRVGDGRRRRARVGAREARTSSRRRARAADPPDVRGAPAALRQARRPARPHLARAGADRRRARAAPARVRLQAGRVGEAAASHRELERDDSLARLGPEAWPDPPELGALLDAPRPLHAMLRDQHVIAGIGRSWVDEILWEARLSPYKRGADLQDDEPRRLREAIDRGAGRRDRALRVRGRSCRSPTSCRCRCRCTATRASRARAARRRCARCTSRTT